MADPVVIVVGNEKGGAGKSTLAIHIVTGLLHAGKRVAIIDLDLRQRSLDVHATSALIVALCFIPQSHLSCNLPSE